MSHIRNELYGVKADETGVYLFGGTGDESGYSEQIAPFESSDVWNGWMLKVDGDGEILHSAVFCQGGVNTATEYGCLIDGGYVVFNDTDAGGDTEVGVMRIAELQPTGIAQPAGQGVQVAVYPNPVEDVLWVTGLPGGAPFAVTDPAGRRAGRAGRRTPWHLAAGATFRPACSCCTPQASTSASFIEHNGR